MSTPAIMTIEKMLESLPEDVQERVVDHLREYILDLQDELRWNAQFEASRDRLLDIAYHVRQEIAAGLAEPMDFDRL